MITAAAWGVVLGAGSLLDVADDEFEAEARLRVIQRAIELDGERAERYGIAVANAITQSQRGR